MNKKNRKKTNRLIIGILNLSLLAALLFYFYGAWHNSAFPLLWHIAGMGLVLLFFLIGYKMRRYLVKVVIILLIMTLGMGHIVTQSLLVQVFDESGQRVKKSQISLIELKTTTTKPTSFYKEAHYGFNSQLDEELKKYVVEQLGNDYKSVVALREYDSTSESVKALYDKKIDVMILDESQRLDILEKYPTFSSDTRILKTYEKETLLSSSAKRVNPIKNSFIVYFTGNDIDGSLSEISRSDVNLLAVVNPHLSKVLLVSIPRDSLVDVGCIAGAQDKLTHVGNFGIDCQIETIKDLIEKDINYYVRVNFSTTMNIIDIMGGSITIYNPYAFQGHTSEYYFEQGCLSLDKSMVMNYVRTRYELPNGDVDRQEHQKMIFKSMLKKVASVNRIFEIGGLFRELSKQIDTNIDAQFVNQLIAYQLEKAPDWDIVSLVIEAQGDMAYTYSVADIPLSVQILDETSLESVKESITEFMKAKTISEVSFLAPKAPVISEMNQPTQSEPSSETSVVVEPVEIEDIEKVGIIVNPFTSASAAECELLYSK